MGGVGGGGWVAATLSLRYAVFLSRNITNDPEVLAQIPRPGRTRGGGRGGDTHTLELETPAGRGWESREQPGVLCQ